MVISLGSVGLPGQVSFMATNMPVTQAMGLPVAPLGLLLAVDTIPDVFATVGNVTADLTATSVVARQAARRDIRRTWAGTACLHTASVPHGLAATCDARAKIRALGPVAQLDRAVPS